MAYTPSDADLQKIDNSVHTQVVQFYAFKTWWSNDEAVASVMGSRTAMLEAVSNFTKMSKYSKESLKNSIISDAQKDMEENQQTATTLFIDEEAVAISDVSTATVSWVPYLGEIAAAVNIAVHVGMEEAITEKKRELDEQLELSSNSANWLTNYPEIQSALNLTQYMVDLGKQNATGNYISKTIMGYVQDRLVNRSQVSIDEVKSDFDNMAELDGVFWMSFHSDAVDSLVAADDEERSDYLGSLETLRGSIFAITILRGSIEAGEKLWKPGEKLWEAYKSHKEAKAQNRANNNVIRLEDPDEMDEMRLLVDENKIAPWKKTEEVAKESIGTEAKVLAVLQIILGVAEGVVAYVEKSTIDDIIDDIHDQHVQYAAAVAEFWEDVDSNEAVGDEVEGN